MTAQSSEGLKHYAIESFESINEAFVLDLNAMSEESLGKSWFGSRTAYDIAYEVGVLNRQIAMRCREEDPGPWPWKFRKEWLKAPAELQSKAAIVQHIEDAGRDLLGSIGADLEKHVPTSTGTRPIYQLVIGAARHTFYHDAQLNFIQELSGDMTVHWKED